MSLAGFELGLFYFFAALCLGSALVVVGQRNPLYSAFGLIVTLCSLSAIFGLLGSPFIAALQVIVYAGAIMVLFLFVVMLLNRKGETPLLTPGAAKGFGFLFALIVFVELIWTAVQPASEGHSMPEAVPLPADFGSPAALGRVLYTVWLYPFEITSILLLVAVVGAVVLAKRKFF